jgi:hypothetical protein
MEEAAMTCSGAMKKRHRGRHLAAGRRGKSKELTGGNCESWRKLAAACRKMTRRAATAQGTQSQGIRPGQCGTRNPERTAAREETKVAPGRRLRNKGPRRQMTAVSQEREGNRERHWRVELRTASTSRSRGTLYKTLKKTI